MRFLPSLSVVLLILSVARASAQALPSGGLLVAYRPREGERANLVAGYRRHLEWHKANADSLTWHAWDVLTGPALGALVDGTFGRPFAALDARVDPAGDERDAAVNIHPYAEPAFRQLLRIRADLSTAMPLESGSPTRLVQVIRYVAPFANAEQLRAVLARFKEAAGARSMLPYTVYECITCEGSSVVLMIWRNSFGSFDDAASNPDRVLQQMLEAQAVQGVVMTSNETWLYRPDLQHRGTTRNDFE